MTYEEEAKEIIERAKAVQPTCEKCLSVSHQAAGGAFSAAHGWVQMLDFHEVAQWMLEQHNFDEDPNRAGFLRRCAACKSSLLFPWADKLDAERVAHMLEFDPRCAYAFELKILEETLADG